MKPLILLACCVSFAAHAEYYTGNSLLALMRGNTNEQIAALGYVTGAADALRGTTHCTPNAVTVGQVHDMTRQAIEDMPQMRHHTADSFVSYVLNKSWPCPKRGTGT